MNTRFFDFSRRFSVGFFVMAILILPYDFCALRWNNNISLIASSFAAEPHTSARPGDRQSIFSKVNFGGPEDWPEDQGLSTAGDSVSPQNTTHENPEELHAAASEVNSAEPNSIDKSISQPSTVSPQSSIPQESSSRTQSESGQIKQSEPSTSGSKTNNESAAQGGRQISGPVNDSVVGVPGKKEEEPAKEETPRPVIYVDEQGNPVAKPMDFSAIWAEIERLMEEHKYEEALPQLEELKIEPKLNAEQHEKVLYAISDCLWAHYADNPLAGFEPIVASTSEAMNANLRSLRVPEALLRLGLANVNVGNLADAAGYIVALYRRYPDYPGVAQGFTALGKAQASQHMDAKAEQSFSMVLDKYPESSCLLDASVGLAHSLMKQRKDDKAHVILDFISKRWPRYYIDDPSFILLQASNEEARDNPQSAINLYWLYYNLVPDHQGNDAMLFKMADMYTASGNKMGAEFLYGLVQRRYSDTPFALRAELRLAEGGIFDSHVDYETMSHVFATAESTRLLKVYADLVKASKFAPDSVLVPLKEAMWLYWSKRYTEAMGKAADFIDSYPENPNVTQARDIIWMSFQKELANSMAEKNYGRILILWNGFPLVRERYGSIDPAMRYALAQGLMERGEESGALSMLAGFLKPTMDPNYGELAFTEFFNRYLKSGQWSKILDLGKLVSAWPMNPQLRSQLDYALALSAQNLNLNAPALAMWRKLASNNTIPLYQRAYATYFLARDAEMRKDIREAYNLNVKVIELFTRLQDERSDKADPQRIKDAMVALMDICEVGNRIPEALDWVHKYNEYSPQNSPEYPGLRFREARLYRKLGDAVRACALLEELAYKYPESPFGKAASAELRTFEVSRDLQNYLPGDTAGQTPQTSSAQSPAEPGTTANEQPSRQ